LQNRGYSAADAAKGATSRIYEMMLQQATVLAYVDTVHILVVMTACLIPIGYLMTKPRFRTKPVEPIE
jgi:hypothetical protein